MKEAQAMLSSLTGLVRLALQLYTTLATRHSIRKFLCRPGLHQASASVHTTEIAACLPCTY